MFLSALTLTAALQAVPAAPAAPPAQISPSSEQKPAFNRTFGPAGARTPLECRMRAMKAREDAIAKGEPLIRMPRGVGERAVFRMVDGCPVRTPIVQSRPAR